MEHCLVGNETRLGGLGVREKWQLEAAYSWLRLVLKGEQDFDQTEALRHMARLCNLIGDAEGRELYRLWLGES